MGILEGNIEIIKAANELKLIKEGRWRKHSLVHGKYQDEIWYGILKSEMKKIKFAK